MQKTRKNLIAAAVLPLSVSFALLGGGAAQAATTPGADSRIDLDRPAALTDAVLQYPVDPCVDGGPTAEDEAAADRLNGVLGADMAGHMDGYRTSCARAVIEAVQDRGIDRHAAVVAITTVIVETHLQNINVEVDHDSLGLFQQRAHWGSPAQRLDPDYATNAFLDEMERIYPNGSWIGADIGTVCQDVQRSAYPERYGPQAGDAQIIVDDLWPV